jgi:hypothetical protein
MGLSLINASNGSGEAVRASVTAIRTAGSTSITVDFTTNWPASFVATSGKLLSSGIISGAFVFSGHLSAGAIIIDSLAPGYTDPGNVSGDIVIIKPTTKWADNIATTLAVSLTDAGAINTAGLTQVATGLVGKQIRLKPRTSVTTSATTLIPNIDSYNVYELNAQTTALSISNPSGTPNDGDVIIIKIQGAAAQTIAYGTAYADVSGLGFLTTTIAGKWHYIGIQYTASATVWHIISVTTQA